MEILTEVSKNETQSLVNLVKNEASYLCCFNRYAQEFEQRNDVLKAKLEDVSITIDKARGASHVTYSALQWKCEAEKLIVVANDTKKEKCLKDLCLNCWRHYQKGRGLAKQTLDIDKLLERCNFKILAGPTDLPGIKYHCLQNFMHFESRNAKLQDLRETLKGEEHVTIGLHGLGGTGKTSMAKEVGAELEGSTFGKVIILVVSNPPDFKKLQREIARHLDLELKDGEQELLQDRILKKISEIKERLLIVLDDVWGEFNLTIELGIPPRHMRKTCTILITTRNKDICTKMECQREIHLVALTNKEALSLFLEHTDSASNLESLAPKIVKHCHGIPVVIVAVARSLKGQPPIVWKEALRNLQSGRSILNARGDGLKMAYEGLKLSYDNLRSEKTKKLFLISSLFPEDFEIPMEFLMGIGVGMGPFGEVDDYSERRRQVLDAIVVELLGSSLLLSAERQCVKMHDLVHEVALLIGEKELMQSLIESTSHVKRGLQCLLWKSTAFPKYVDGRNLEILLIFLVQDGLTDLEVPDKFFTDMKKLKVLVLQCESGYRLLAPSLLPSIQSLQDIRTLKLVSLKLCSIFVLENLPNLENLWLDNCSFIKLPEESFRLGELRCLRIEECEIKMSNPFDLIEASPNLEEFTFLHNEYGYDDASSQKVSFHMLHIYQIYSYRDLSDYFEKYGSLSRCFAPNRSLKRLLSEKTFEELARTAEFLCLTGDEETEQKNLIPDIVVPVDDGGMTDLIILQLVDWSGMHCLIDTMNPSYVNAFSNLAEIFLYGMGLSNILFDGNYNLCHLKTMTLRRCPKLTSIFLPSTAQNLLQLEDLIIENCDELECIIPSDNGQKSYNTMLPKLKTLQIKSCGNLEIILPMLSGGDNMERITIEWCEKLKYIFDKFQEANVMLPSLQEIELEEVPSLVGIFREYEKSISSPLQQPACTSSTDNLKEIIPSTRKHSFSWAKVCCFKSKRATCEKINGAVSVGRLNDEGIPQGLPASKKWIDAAPAPKIVKQLVLHAHCIRKMKLAYVSLYSVSTLCTLSIASMISWEELEITKCDGLKHLVTSDEDDYKQINHGSIFPKLQNLEIRKCQDLEILFLSSISIKIEVLKSLTIRDAPKLSYVVGKYQNDELHFDLPALEALCFEDVPELISILPMKFKLVSPYLQKICLDEEQLTSNTTKELDASTEEVPPFYATQSLLVQSLKNVRDIYLHGCGNIISLSTLAIATSTISLETLTIRKCHKLKCITTHEGDAEFDKNYSCPLFPRLEHLGIVECEELEFLFVSAISFGLEKLKSLTIDGVPKLEYVVGNSQKEQHSSDQNQIVELHFNLPALETLCIEDAPMISGVCSKNYKAILSSLRNIYVRNCGIKSFSTGYKMANLRTTQGMEMCWKTLETLRLYDCKIEEIFDLTYMKTEKKGDQLQPLTSNLQLLLLHKLSDLMNICVGPKRIICFRSLQSLSVSQCKKLRVLFSASVVRSLPMLTGLYISTCEELVHIVEEDYETNADDHLRHGPCFPELQSVTVTNCDKLKYLFSITISDILPKLQVLEIREANELEHILIKRDEMEEMSMKSVLPQLREVYFANLPNLISVCHEINFQKEGYITIVLDCPKFETSTTQHQAEPETENSQVEEKEEERLSSHRGEEITQKSLTKDKLVDKEVKKETTVMEPKSQEEMTQYGIQSHEEEEEEEKEGGLITTRGHRIDIKTKISLLKEKLEDPIHESELGNSQAKPKAEEMLSSHMGETQQFLTKDEFPIKKVNNEAMKMDQTSISKENPTKDEDELVRKVVENETTKIDPQQSTMATQHLTKDELVCKEVYKNTLMMEPQPQQETTGHDIRYHEEEEREGDAQLPDKSQVLAIDDSNGTINIVPNIMHPITSLEGVNNEGIKEASAVKNKSKTNVACHGDQANPSNLTQTEAETSHSRGPIVESNNTTKLNIVEDAKLSMPTFSTPIEIMPSLLWANNEASNVHGVQEIVDMMKLEGFERSMFVKALETRPQLRLSTKDRSARVLRMSYRVLVDVLNILTTKTPFTITEADKKMLCEHLKDSYLLGFDKDWIESIKTKVFDCEISEVDSIQKVLKGLDNDLKINDEMLEAIHDEEVKAARVVQVAQQDHASVMARHAYLLKSRQDIIEQRHQCVEKIAAKNRHFGF